MTILHLISSKDRAPQLEFQLRSFHHLPKDIHSTVVYTYSDDRNKALYEEIIALYPNIDFRYEDKPFKNKILEVIEEYNPELLFFTPDDGVFLRDVDSKLINFCGESAIMFSLRMGRHLEVCHPLGNKAQPLPAFTERMVGNKMFLIWDWASGESDWGYPMALDGSVFLGELFHEMILCSQFDKPTSLENSIQKYSSLMSRSFRGGCLEEAQFVSIPWNAITDQAANKNAGISIDEFNSMWESGKRISMESLDRMPNSCHYEFPLIWEDR